MKPRYVFINLCFIMIFLQGCFQEPAKDSNDLNERTQSHIEKVPLVFNKKNEQINLDAFHREPKQWGEHVTGVKTSMKTTEKELSLTFDACGGLGGNGYDAELISFLREENIHATLFVNERWIQANENLFIELAHDPLFQIENHGTKHKPLSVNGGEAWGIEATESPEEIYEEIMSNHDTVKSLVGKEMTLFRSGTAFYDEVAVELANELGYDVVNFDILGDAGATFSSEQVKNALLEADHGSIALLHMNQPGSETAQGVMQAIPILIDQGFEFVLLEDAELE